MDEHQDRNGGFRIGQVEVEPMFLIVPARTIIIEKIPNLRPFGYAARENPCDKKK
jgi:hypothetical protein